MRGIAFETNEVAIEVRKLGMPHCEGPNDLSQDRKQFNAFCLFFFARTMMKESGHMMKKIQEMHQVGVEISRRRQIKTHKDNGTAKKRFERAELITRGDLWATVYFRFAEDFHKTPPMGFDVRPVPCNFVYCL
jgi:hypothetical protein